jgi:hypothetical protein
MISHCTDVKAPTLKFEKRCSLLVKAHTPAGTLENDRREQQQRTTTENDNGATKCYPKNKTMPPKEKRRFMFGDYLASSDLSA